MKSETPSTIGQRFRLRATYLGVGALICFPAVKIVTLIEGVDWFGAWAGRMLAIIAFVVIGGAIYDWWFLRDKTSKRT